MSTTAAEGTWHIGDVIEDLYEVRWQTQGGMGVVYRVHHRGWNMDLAVKTPRPELVSSPQRMADFETEAETWVGLGLHPNIVACVYVRRLDGLPRVFAEWVDGGSLHDAIQSRRLYEGTHEEVLARILDVAIQFAWGLDYAHSRGLIHQDVKPLNVMCTADWTVKVTDFGLAKARAAAGETTNAAPGASVLAGYGGMTPAYCSPEQATAAHSEPGARGNAVLTRATDVWSWAISVWEMFTGEPPCRQGQAAAEAFEAFREEPWVDDPAIPAMPDAVAEMVGRSLDPDATTRPRYMGELSDELAELHRELVGVPYPRNKPEPAKLMADGLNNQALSMHDLGRIEQSGQLWQQALANDPHHVDAVFNHGLRRWRTGQITDIDLISQLEAVRVSHPGPHADRLLASIHLERCDNATARTLLTTAVREAPSDPAIAEALTAAHRPPELTARTLTAYNDHVFSVAVSADRHFAVSSARGDKTVQVWDLASGACLHSLTGHRAWVSSVGISADGRIAVSGGSLSDDKTVRVWDVASAGCLHTLTGHTTVNSVGLSADGRVAVSAGGWDDPTVRVWELARGTCLRTLTGHTAVSSVALSAEGRIAVSGGGVHDETVRVWDLASGACVHTLTGHTGTVESVAVSADGRIAVSGGYDKAVRVWGVRTGRCLRSLTGHTDEVESVAVSADCRVAVSGSWDETVRVWDLASGVCLRTLTGHAGGVTSVAVSADGRVAVSGGSDHTVRVWDVPTMHGYRAGWSYSHPHSADELLTRAAAVEVALRRAETLLAAGDGAGAAARLRTARAIPGYRRNPQLVGLWRQLAALGMRGRLENARPLHTLTDFAESVAVSADGRIAVSASGDTVRVWDLADGACLRTLTGHTDTLLSVAVSADGRTAVSGSRDKTVRVWDLVNGTCLHTLTGHTEWVQSVALSADGRIAVSASYDKMVRVWNVASGACPIALTDHTCSVGSVGLSADGRIVVWCSGPTSGDNTVWVWDLASGVRLHTLTGHTAYVSSMAVSSDGRIAVSASGDFTVRVWDLSGGACRRILTDHTHPVGSVAVSADGRVAVWESGDSTVRVWDLRSGSCLRTLTGHTHAVKSVAVSADGHTVVSCSHDATVRVWDLDWEYKFAAQGSAGAAATTSRLDRGS